MECIITGCGLVFPGQGWVPCDIFRTDSGDIVAHVSPTHLNEKFHIVPLAGEPHYSKQVIFGGRCWVRQGVLIASSEETTFNDAALHHIGNLP